jgi:hypothetical protein
MNNRACEFQENCLNLLSGILYVPLSKRSPAVLAAVVAVTQSSMRIIAHTESYLTRQLGNSSLPCKLYKEVVVHLLCISVNR